LSKGFVGSRVWVKDFMRDERLDVGCSLLENKDWNRRTNKTNDNAVLTEASHR